MLRQHAAWAGTIQALTTWWQCTAALKSPLFAQGGRKKGYIDAEMRVLAAMSALIWIEQYVTNMLVVQLAPAAGLLAFAETRLRR